MTQPSPALPAATVLLVRDAPRFEVLMVERHRQVEFASGALVFPGGKVEPGDGDPAWADHADGWGAMEPAERGVRVCAVREAFEESGILLARRADGGPPGIGAVAPDERARIAASGEGFRGFVAGRGLRLDLSAMVPFAHWITPAGSGGKRFDTRFFLADAPDAQTAACDGHETVDAVWLPPAEALRLHAAGARTIVFPTRLNLQLLAESPTADAAAAAARARRVVPIEPRLERGADGPIVSIPADAGYGDVPPQRL